MTRAARARFTVTSIGKGIGFLLRVASPILVTRVAFHLSFGVRPIVVGPCLSTALYSVVTSLILRHCNALLTMVVDSMASRSSIQTRR